MKILSINRQHTRSEHEIAVNLDKEIPPDLMALVSYGDLTLSATGSVLHVGKEEGDAAFDHHFVGELEQLLNDAQKVLDEKANRPRRLQEMVARATKLPLD